MFTVETSGRMMNYIISRTSFNPQECRALRFLDAETEEIKITRLYWEHILIELLIRVHWLNEQLV